MRDTPPAEPSIVVDGVFFQLNNTGIARVWKEILTRWQDSEIGSRIVVLNRRETLPKFERLRTISCPEFNYNSCQRDRRLLQEICDSVGAALFISTYYTRPERTRSVLLVHDMIPERLGQDPSNAMWQQKHDAILHATAYAANSKNTLSDLWEFFPETRSKPTRIALPGVSPELFPPSPEERQKFHREFVIPYLGGRPYYLFVSDPSSYKNAGLLFRALASMPPLLLNGVALLLTHTALLAGFRSLPLLESHAAWLSDADLRLAYGSALGLIYPSLYEGFGLPVLEAMACGCPVICTALSSLPEVVGDAALFTDPYDHNWLRNNLLRLQIPELRHNLQRRGLERAKNFSWDKMALDVADFVMTVS